MTTWIKFFCVAVAVAISPVTVFAAISIPFTVNLSEAVTVDTAGGTPRIAVDVGGVTRYATYTSGTGTSSLIFTYDAAIGDVDLDGVALSSPIDLNGGTITDTAGNGATLTFTPPNTTNVRVNYPSLGMDFIADADGRYTLNGAVYNDLPSFLTATGGTFSRASIGTYYDAAGVLQTAASGVPRFDHDPVTNAAKGILIEEARTNEIVNSTDLKSPLWLGYCGNWLTTYVPDPAGGNNAVQIPADSDGCSFNVSGLYKCTTQFCNGSNFPAGTYTVSVWGRTVSGTLNIGITTDDTSYSPQCTLTTTWKRCFATVTKAATDALYGPRMFQVVEGAANNQAYELFGPQVEQGSFPTSYIPTTTAAVTRAADVLTMPTGSWYNQSAGTGVGTQSHQSNAGTGFPMLWRFDDTTNNNRWNAYHRQSDSHVGFDGVTAGFGQGSNNFASTSTATTSIAGRNALNNMRAAKDGVLGPLDTTWTPPTVTQFVGGLQGQQANKWMQKFKYYPLALSDTQLQLLTQ
ncbi:MAG: hypothetical protein AUJ12_07635 [Alphaproteobacteria bacterium CG1_02_46_17]|nr:MAG: hypothetical protein AUJ12_07635 [Alphaproteobacteria bacterium CG1_02_46_17]